MSLPTLLTKATPRFLSRTQLKLSNTRDSSSSSHTTSLKDPIYNQTLTLPDGRTLGFAEFGSPTGSPIFFFHGWPSSRLEGWGADEIAKRHQLRIIAPDRPGFGLSTLKPVAQGSGRSNGNGSSSADFKPRRIIDWPSDIRTLADHLRLERFAVLGGSGGGPFALACAKELPKGMLSAVGLLASAGPWRVEAGSKGANGEKEGPKDRNGRTEEDLLTKETPWVSWGMYLAATHFPRGFEVLANGLVSLGGWITRTKAVERRLDQWLEKLEEDAKKEEERKSKEKPSQVNKEADVTLPNGDERPSIAELRNRTIQIGLEGFAQGSGGFVHEAYLLSHPWGFKFEDVDYDKIHIWHGTLDKNAPIRQIRYMAKHLPHSVLHEFEDADHFKVANHLEDVLLQLVPKKDS